MADLDLMRELSTTADTKIVLLVMDGLGGVPKEPGGPAELEFACTPNLDRLAVESMVGLSIDHTTPAVWKAHSWHPVPTLFHAQRLGRRNEATGFGESECLL